MFKAKASSIRSQSVPACLVQNLSSSIPFSIPRYPHGDNFCIAIIVSSRLLITYNVFWTSQFKYFYLTCKIGRTSSFPDLTVSNLHSPGYFQNALLWHIWRFFLMTPFVYLSSLVVIFCLPITCSAHLSFNLFIIPVTLILLVLSRVSLFLIIILLDTLKMLCSGISGDFLLFHQWGLTLENHYRSRSLTA